jgi:histidinol-phosphate phosphatase family protein
MRRSLFLDRDGTLNYDYSYTHKLSQLRLYTDIPKLIRKYKRMGYITIVITNQSGIGRGYYTEAQMKRFNSALNKRLEKLGAGIDAFYWCPHKPDDNCDCRKPNTKLVERAARDFNIDLKKSMFIGDTEHTDGEIARRLGMKYTILKRRHRPDKGGPAKSAQPPNDSVPEAVIILCGGKGTRLRPLTYKIPKPMAKVGRRPIIAYVIDNLLRVGVKNLILSAGYKADMVENYVDSHYAQKANITYSEDRRLLGTGGAIRKAMEDAGHQYKNFVVVNGDDITDIDVRKVYAFHLRKKAPVTVTVLKLDHVNVSGAIKLKNGLITGFIEKPDPNVVKSKLTAAGIYVFSAESLRFFPKRKVFNLSSDFLEPAVKRKIIYGYLSKHNWYPIDTPERYDKAKAALKGVSQ